MDEPRYLTFSCPCSSSPSEPAIVRWWMMDCRLAWLWLMARKASPSIQVRNRSCSGLTSSSSSLFPNWILFQILKKYDKNKALNHETFKTFPYKEEYRQVLIICRNQTWAPALNSVSTNSLILKVNGQGGKEQSWRLGRVLWMWPLDVT